MIAKQKKRGALNCRLRRLDRVFDERQINVNEILNGDEDPKKDVTEEIPIIERLTKLSHRTIKTRFN